MLDLETALASGATAATQLRESVEVGATVNQPIPDGDPRGIDSTLEITRQGTVSAIKVQVAIEHTYIGDLQVSVRGPTGPPVLLHDREGGSRNDLRITYRETNLPALSSLLGSAAEGT